jgi:uncharacterized protein (DUF1330 family)
VSGAPGSGGPGSAAPAGGPPAYLLVQGKVTDIEGFRLYNAALPPIYEKYGGRYLAVTPASRVEVAEGEPRLESIVIARFPSKEAAWGFWKSAEYEAAKKLREGKGEFFVTVLDGIPGT